MTLTRRFWSLSPSPAPALTVRRPRLTAEPEGEPGGAGGLNRRWFIGMLGLVVAKPDILLPRDAMDAVLAPEGLIEAIRYDAIYTLPPNAWLWGIPYHHNPDVSTATWLGLERGEVDE